MLLKTVNPTTNEFIDIPIDEGDMYLLPPNTPHNPVRFADTVGVVIEQIRPADSIDKLRWYCQECKNLVHEKSFHCTDLGTQIKAAVEEFAGDKEARTCKKCGTICQVRPGEKV
jgi:3-hydroxyanthranilate 3,4-dioxygenase